jgi:aspartate-semialdehyde dehydrogenase
MNQPDETARPGSAVLDATEKIPVAVLGATGSVGQRFVQLLENHPWFRLHEVVASERSAGREYGVAADWRLDTPLPSSSSGLVVKGLDEELESTLLFSALDSSIAGEAESRHAERGCAVLSNSKNHRMDPDVPLLIPEINADHTDAIERQRKRWKGYIVTNPNCSTIGLAMAIAPIERQHGIDQLHVTTLQAISGAGYSGVASYAILDNVIPWISSEEEKIEIEPRKILGRWTGEEFRDAPISISAQVNRVPVIDGHLMSISLAFRNRDDLRRHFPIERLIDDARRAMDGYAGEPQRLRLPSAPRQPIRCMVEDDRPQPRLDRDYERGMSVSVGRLRPCPVFDIRMVALVHNTIRGAAGAALLNAELLKAKNLLP